MIERESQVPIYRQLSDAIEEQINNGILMSGDKISSINDLMQQYGVSRVTAVRAIENLVKKGLIISKQGKGNFVRTKHRVEELSTLRSFKEIWNEGDKISDQILSFDYVQVPNTCSEIFTSEQLVLNISRLHLQEESPIAYVNIYIPEEIARSITKEDAQRLSVYEIMEKSNIQVTNAIQEISAEPARKPITNILQVKDGFPLLVNRRKSLTETNSPVMYGEFYYRHDAYSFITKLERNQIERIK